MMLRIEQYRDAFVAIDGIPRYHSLYSRLVHLLLPS